MRLVALLGVAAAMAIPSCGSGDSDDSGPGRDASDASSARERDSAAGTGDSNAARNAKREATGTAIAVGDSEFGQMLFGSDDQAIYIFENDREDETVCYGECAEDWPPVLTEGQPQGKQGVDDSLLGTLERRDGTLQVTYDGQPLYFYANEQPGEVRCHNVNLNGGFWWAVAPNGERLP